jgi:hypothetical protein
LNTDYEPASDAIGTIHQDHTHHHHAQEAQQQQQQQPGPLQKYRQKDDFSWKAIHATPSPARLAKSMRRMQTT